MDIIEVARSIPPVSQEHLQKAQSHLDKLAIPRGSLGRLMELGRQVLSKEQTGCLAESPLQMNVADLVVRACLGFEAVDGIHQCCIHFRSTLY